MPDRSATNTDRSAKSAGRTDGLLSNCRMARNMPRKLGNIIFVAVSDKTGRRGAANITHADTIRSPREVFDIRRFSSGAKSFGRAKRIDPRVNFGIADVRPNTLLDIFTVTRNVVDDDNLRAA